MGYLWGHPVIRGAISGCISGAVTSSLGAGGGAYLATLSALRAHLATTDGADNPHSLAENTGLATITTPSSKESAYSKGFAAGSGSALVDPDTWLARYYGGSPLWRSGNSVGFASTTVISGGNLNSTKTANSHSYRVQTNAPAIYYSPRRNSSAASHRVIVNGQYVSKTAIAVGNDINQKWIKVDFGSAADRVVEFESVGPADLYGIYVEPAYTLVRPAEARPRMLVFGDSFVGGAGAVYANDLLGAVCADYLGLQRPQQSGVGGTGWLNTGPGGTGGTFRTRLTTDVTNTGPWDLIVVTTAGNDGSADEAALAAEVNVFFDQLRAENPAAVVVVASAWNAAAPSAPSAGDAMVTSVVNAAVSGRAGMYYLDPSDVEFTKIDGTHGDVAGHLTMGSYLASAIRTALA